jgi:GTP-binding protein
VVDFAPFDEDVDAVAEAKAIAGELKKYDPGLYKKPRWLVLNKADLLDPAERDKRARAFVKKLAWKGPWYVVSAIRGEGTRELCFAIMEFLENARGKA